MARRRFKSRGNFGKRRRSRSVRRNVKRIRRIVRGVRPECKYFPTVVAQAAVAGPTISILNAMAQGDAIGQRIGHKVIGTGLHMNGFVINRTATQQLMRIVLFRWLQIVPPTSPTDILQYNSITSTYAPDQVGVKFTIMKDFTLPIAPVAAQGGIHTFKIGKKLKNYVQYQGPNAADWTKNVIYVMFYPSSAAMDVQYECMYRYVDA